MAAITLSTLPYNTAVPREARTGANDPNGNPDNYNRVARALWTLFKVEHDKDGDHKSDLLTSSSKIEVGSYTGNGTDDRDITIGIATPDIVMIWSEVVDAYFTPYSPIVWSSSVFQIFEAVKSVTMLTDVISDPEYSDLIQVVTGLFAFQIGANHTVNKNAETYYYLAMN